MTDQEIIKALRCSASIDCKCIRELCPFFVQEEVPEELREKCGGKDKLDGCDVDGIALAAADRLEQLLKPTRPATSLVGKCGSCEYAIPTKFGSSECYIECTNRPQNGSGRTGIAHIKQRTTPACKRYRGKGGADHEN